jgi:beta-glucosidase
MNAPALLLLLAQASGAAAPASRSEARVEDLLRRMTLEEKLGQLQQLDGLADGAQRPEHADLIRKGRLGSTLNVRGAVRTNALQRIAVEESRLGIPVLFGFDVIHGYRTIFPIPLGQAASWDPALVERAAGIAAAEARAVGLRWTFAPMVDIARDARWGRVAEGSGEDPFLGSAMAAALVRGYQGDDPAAPGRVAACAKHWVAYGAAEAGRDYNGADLSERTLREVYFPPFKAALEAGVVTFMSAFNDLNGIPASANPFTLTDVLRGEWGFDGFVVSDYESVRELLAHGVAAGEADAALAALQAGVEMEMVSRLYARHVPGLLEQGRLSAATLDEAVRRVLRTKARLGLFESPYEDEAQEARILRRPEHRAAARALAGRSMVLLKNEGGALPLGHALRSLAVIGPLADDRAAMLGSWTGDGRVEDVVTPLAGIRARAGSEVRVEYARGCDVEGASDAGFPEAVALARRADAALLLVGERGDMSGEAASRSSLDLPGRQLDLVKAVHATGTPTVVVLANGRPLTIGWIAENVPAVLETWFAGTEAGHAVADVLWGDVNPGGKLPVTFPRSVGQVPLYYGHKRTGRPPSAEKYTSKYLDVPVTPLYPFGHGLSYTVFQLSDLQLSGDRIPRDGALEVQALLTNTGPRAGDEVVQLYLSDLAASVTRPVNELKGFARVSLQAGERRRVAFRLGPRELGFLDRDLKFVVEPGTFKVTVGQSSVGGLEALFEVSGS